MKTRRRFDNRAAARLREMTAHHHEFLDTIVRDALKHERDPYFRSARTSLQFDLSCLGGRVRGGIGHIDRSD